MQVKTIYKILLVQILLLSSNLSARFFVPDSAKQFDDIMAQYDLAVVYFNPYGVGDIPQDEEDTVSAMKQDFIELAQDKRYLNANVAFVGVNTARISALAKQFNVEPDAKATLILFKDGNEYKEAKRKTGYLTKGQMRSFIEKYFGDIIDRILAQRKETKVVKRYYTRPTYTRTYSYPSDYYDYYDYDYYPRYRYSSPYYYGSYGYPYYGYGPGFGFNVGGDGFGFGIGFGF